MILPWIIKRASGRDLQMRIHNQGFQRPYEPHRLHQQKYGVMFHVKRKENQRGICDSGEDKMYRELSLIQH